MSSHVKKGMELGRRNKPQSRQCVQISTTFNIALMNIYVSEAQMPEKDCMYTLSFF